MKILITAPSLDENENVSGISSVVRQIVEKGNAEFFHFTAGRKDNEGMGINWFLRQLFLAPRLFREIKKQKIQLVHVNATLTKLSILRDAALIKTARAAGVPVLLHIHGGKYLTRDFDSKFLSKLAGAMFRGASVIVVLSSMEKDLLKKRRKNLRIRVLENAVSLENVKERKAETREKTLIFLGRFHESKGLHEMVEACRILKNENFAFRFRAFGAGDLRDFFVREMTGILGENFFYGGVIAGAEKWKALAESDIFLLPSRYGEGLPVALLEAMASGCAPVVSEMASVAAVVKDGVNGFLIEPGNAAQLTGKLRFLLSGEVVWESLRENARSSVEEKFNLNDYIKKLEKIYAEIKE